MITEKEFGQKIFPKLVPQAWSLDYPPFGKPDFIIPGDNAVFFELKRASSTLFKPTSSFRNEYDQFPNVYFPMRWGRVNAPKYQSRLRYELRTRKGVFKIEKYGELTWVVNKFPKPLILLVFDVSDGKILVNKKYAEGDVPPYLTEPYYQYPAT